MCASLELRHLTALILLNLKKILPIKNLPFINEYLKISQVTLPAIHIYTFNSKNQNVFPQELLCFQQKAYL